MKKGSIIAFKTLEGKWYTGKVSRCDESDFEVRVTLPIEPQWYEDEDKTLYYSNEISDFKILEP